MISFLKSLFGARTAAPPPAVVDEAQAMEDLRLRLRSDIAAGFMTREEIIEVAVDYVDGEIETERAHREVEKLWPEFLAEHQAAQADWPETTDCDRLDAAFAALETKGIIARQNFTCCGTCGSYEIGDEIEAAQKAGLPAHGYTFYHMQDTDRAVEGDGIYLNYGSEEEGEEAALAVAAEIVAELEAHGLQTNWNGSLNQRIGVSLDWKRRAGFAA